MRNCRNLIFFFKLSCPVLYTIFIVSRVSWIKKNIRFQQFLTNKTLHTGESMGDCELS